MMVSASLLKVLLLVAVSHLSSTVGRELRAPRIKRAAQQGGFGSPLVGLATFPCYASCEDHCLYGQVPIPGYCSGGQTCCENDDYIYQGGFWVPAQGDFGAPPQGGFGARPQGGFGSPPQGNFGAPSTYICSASCEPYCTRDQIHIPGYCGWGQKCCENKIGY